VALLSALGVSGQAFVHTGARERGDEAPADSTRDVEERLVGWRTQLYGTADVDGYESLLHEQDRGRRRSAAAPPEAKTQESGVADLLKELDLDGDGRVGRDEFVKGFESTALTGVLTGDTEAWLDDFYSRADVDKDGFLTEEELLLSTQLMRETVLRVARDALVSAMLRDLDTNRDGSIDYQEILEAASQEEVMDERGLLRQMLRHFVEADLDDDMSLREDEIEALAERILPSS